VLESSVLASGLGIVASSIERVPLDVPADAPDVTPEVMLPALAPEAVPVPAPALAPVLDPALAPVLAPDSALAGGLELPHAVSHAREANATTATTGFRVPVRQRLLLAEAPSNARSWIIARPPKEKAARRDHGEPGQRKPETGRPPENRARLQISDVCAY
jgi:hypothetical protein